MATSRQNTYVPIPHPEGSTPNTGDLVELVFDKFSPRPHFIILSFHRGDWYQEHGTPWHCHLCVPMEEYCHEAKKEAYEKNGFSLVWMMPNPRIGVYSQKPQELRLLYKFMVDVKEQMEKDLLSKDKSFRNFGCHFCLFVSAENQAHTIPRACKVLNETGTDVKTTELVGYIQMDDQQYYRLVPNENHRQTWFNDCKRHDFIVTT
ncbi:unnamed protein product [Adineta steineri]|uniref:Uncharacterized protein n=2 Tax=Adineta steineri TaxID=433720 RepID=A0A819FAH4_9BILA|nr:unnamed protein product [Adineta steineri]CAF3930455.1 unnamed protein product [Adineta steineri]